MRHGRLDLPALQAGLSGTSQCVGVSHLLGFLISFTTNAWPSNTTTTATSPRGTGGGAAAAAAGVTPEVVQQAFARAERLPPHAAASAPPSLPLWPPAPPGVAASPQPLADAAAVANVGSGGEGGAGGVQEEQRRVSFGPAARQGGVAGGSARRGLAPVESVALLNEVRD